MINIVNQGPTLRPGFKNRIDQETGGEWYGKAFHIPLDSVEQDDVASQLFHLKSQLDDAKLNAKRNPTCGYIQHQAQSTQASWEMAGQEDPLTRQAIDQVVNLAAQELNPQFQDQTLFGQVENLGRNDMISVGARGLLDSENDYRFMPKGLLFIDYTSEQPGINIVLARRDKFWD